MKYGVAREKQEEKEQKIPSRAEKAQIQSEKKMEEKQRVDKANAKENRRKDQTVALKQTELVDKKAVEKVKAIGAPGIESKFHFAQNILRKNYNLTQSYTRLRFFPYFFVAHQLGKKML